MPPDVVSGFIVEFLSEVVGEDRRGRPAHAILCGPQQAELIADHGAVGAMFVVPTLVADGIAVLSRSLAIRDGPRIVAFQWEDALFTHAGDEFTKGACLGREHLEPNLPDGGFHLAVLAVIGLLFAVIGFGCL